MDDRKGYLLGSIDERKAVSHYLTVRAARALYHGTQLPWWAAIRRAKAKWSAVAHAVAAKEIEEAAHVSDQAVWLVEINDGVIFGREGHRRCEQKDHPHAQ
jgi:hypothetical protein